MAQRPVMESIKVVQHVEVGNWEIVMVTYRKL